MNFISQPDGRDAQGKVGGRVWSFCVLSRSTTSPNLHVFTNLKAPQTHCFWIFMEASLLPSNILGSWLTLICNKGQINKKKQTEVQ